MAICWQTKGSHEGIWAGVYSGCYDDSGEYSSSAIIYNGEKQIGTVDLEFSHTFTFEENSSPKQEPDDDDLYSIGLTANELEVIAKIVKSLEEDDEDLDSEIWEEVKS